MTTYRGGKTGAVKPAGGLPDEPLSDPLVVLRHLDRLFWRHFHIAKRQLVNFCRAGCPTVRVGRPPRIVINEQLFGREQQVLSADQNDITGDRFSVAGSNCR